MADKIMSYSIIQVNLNEYDEACSCFDTKSEKNLLITDRPQNITGWTQYIYENPNKDFPFDDVFKIRWNPFDYVNSDYIIWIDGSIKINGNLDKYIDIMINGNYDFACVAHFARNDVYTEYQEWCKMRNYNKEKAFKWLSYFQEKGLDINHSGLYEPKVLIFKNNDIIKNFCNDMVKELHYLDNEHYERLDQTVMTMLLKTKYKKINLLVLPCTTYLTNELDYHGNHPNR